MLTVMRLTGGALSVLFVSASFILDRDRRAVADEKIVLLGMWPMLHKIVLAAFALRVRRVTDSEGLDLVGAIAVNLSAGQGNFRWAPGSSTPTGRPNRSSTACSPASMNTTPVDKNSTASWAISSRGRFFWSNWKNQVSETLKPN